MLRAITVAATLVAAGIMACEVSAPGVGAAAPADSTCLDAMAPGDVDGGGGSTVGEGGGPMTTAIADPTDASSSETGASDANVGPGPVCATTTTP